VAQRIRWDIPPSRLLVVDDGAENRELLSLVLAEQGLWVEEAENGQVALDKVAQGGFDLILMDMQMPVLDGFAATRILRERGVQTPIVALTANAMKGFEQEVLQAGCTAYVTKPIDIDGLLAKLAQMLGGAQAGAPVARGEDAAATVLPVETGAAVAAVSQAEPRHEAITSRLAGNARLVPIVRKFAARLDEQLATAERAWQAQDSAEIARFAHWLAGAAGTMGYDAFTGPARELEQFALGGQGENVGAAMAALREMAGRVESPAEPVEQAQTAL
jgi:CheY-like chemotaxis protein/HPt (histidine-containing phosphotransfer) domain-containing protein